MASCYVYEGPPRKANANCAQGFPFQHLTWLAHLGLHYLPRFQQENLLITRTHFTSHSTKCPMKMPISNEIYSFVVSHPISILCAAAVLYPLAVVIYRLYLDPLSAIPGPKLAAITFWYEYYYDGIKKGQYTFQIEKLHKQYGMKSQCH